MRVALFVDWFLPGFKAGGPIRSVENIIANLGEQVEFDIITSVYDAGSKTPYNTVVADKWIDAKNYRIIYLTKKSQNIGNLKKIIDDGRYNVLYLNSMFSYNYSILPLLVGLQSKRNIKIVVAPRGMLQKKALTRRPVRKHLYLFCLKLLRVNKKIIFHACSQSEEIEIIHVFGRKSNVRIIPNFVKPVKDSYTPITKETGKIRLVFISIIQFMKNLNFFIDCLSGIRGEILFDIYGPSQQQDYFEECVKKAAKLKENCSINFKGAIQNERVPAILSNYHFFILPSFGENFGHAIFEALSCGRPVIISDHTPWQDLQKHKAGWDLSINEPDKFIAIIKSCIEMRQMEYNEWSRGAHEFARKFAFQNNVVEKYMQLFVN